jgi:hypothetical protein
VVGKMSKVCESHPLDGFFVFICFTLLLNEMFEIKKVNKGLGKGSIVSDIPFFNNRVYSRPFLCYGNIKIARG